MRNFATDRPDITESAYSVDAGHFQLETDLYKRSITKTNGSKETLKTFNNINLKYGLTNSADIQFVVSSYEKSITSSQVANDVKEGFGGLTIRFKQNIFGNDKGKVALAIMPFVNITLHKGDMLAGGIIIPASFELPQGWSAGAQIEVDFVKPTHSNIQSTYIASATLGHQFYKKLNFFIENVVTFEASNDQAFYFLNGGFTYNLLPDLILDAGTYYCLAESSSRTVFVGCSFRL